MPAVANNLPLQLTSFIGREREMAQVRDLLARNRLVTLTGAGGVGKTRLGLEVAAQLVADYRDGVWLVDLAGLADPALVPHVVAGALGVREERDRAMPEMLAHYLASRQVLIVLDNCEHLLSFTQLWPRISSAAAPKCASWRPAVRP